MDPRRWPLVSAVIHGTIALEITLSAETRAFLTGLVDQLARALVVDRVAVEARIRAEPLQDVDAGQGGMPFGTVASGAPSASVPTPPSTAPANSPAVSPIATASPGGNSRPAGDMPAAFLDVSSETQAPVASRTSDTAGASFPRASKPILWSPERDAVLRDGYPAGQTNRVLLDRVSALPGRQVVLAQILPRCMYLKLRRAPGVHEKPVRPTEPAAADIVPDVLERTEADILQWCAFAKYKVAAPLTAQNIEGINAFRRAKGLPPYQLIAKPSPPPPKHPHTASYGTILRWANDRGLCMDGVLDLDVVNRKARALGATPFVLEEPRRAVPSIIRHHQQQQEDN